MSPAALRDQKCTISSLACTDRRKIAPNLLRGICVRGFKGPGVGERRQWDDHQEVGREVPLESILEVQDLYDNHFDDSPVWQQAVAARL